MLPAADLSSNSSPAEMMASCKIFDENNEIKPKTMLPKGENSAEECRRPNSPPKNGNVTTTMNGGAVANGGAQNRDKIMKAKEMDESRFKTPALPSKKAFYLKMAAQHSPSESVSSSEASTTDTHHDFYGGQTPTLENFLQGMNAWISNNANNATVQLVLLTTGTKSRNLEIYCRGQQPPLVINTNLTVAAAVDFIEQREAAIIDADNERNRQAGMHRRPIRAPSADRDGNIIYFSARCSNGRTFYFSWQP